MTSEVKFEHHQKIHLICEAGLDKKAEEIVIMEMKNRSSLCDYFIVMSASSMVRVKAIAEHLEETMKKEGFRPTHKEGLQEGTWVLLDYSDVIVHVFYHETRKFYDLENLWGDTRKRHFIK